MLLLLLRAAAAAATATHSDSLIPSFPPPTKQRVNPSKMAREGNHGCPCLWNILLRELKSGWVLPNVSETDFQVRFEYIYSLVRTCRQKNALHAFGFTQLAANT